MKFNKLFINLYFYFFCIILGHCKEDFKYECENNSNNAKNEISYSYSLHNFSPLYSNNMNNRMNLNFYPDEINKALNIGESHSISLYINKVYIFNFSSPYYDKENDLLIHFYPLDCQIQIVKENKNDENDFIIEKISNYEYDAFSAIIKKDQLNSTYFKIKALINSINDYHKNRTFHLKINSFEYINNTILSIKEKEPTLLNFNNGFNKIILLYNLTNKEIYAYPISISFFIKERVKFKITVSNDENKILKKIVAYQDRILVDTNFITENSLYLNISIEKIEKEKDVVMIAKVIGDYSTPIYFQKNLLNLGFIPSNISNQYYYIEVFKGEYGEIILNNKRYNGKLISKLIKKEGTNENNIDSSSEKYPKQEIINNIDTDLLKYNEYSQKITLSSEKTKICEDGCYLLITYQSNYFKNENNPKIIGTEFTLLGRILEDEEEFKSPIINIPLNEYIQGSFESSSFNIHYYSLYIPEKTKNITLELNVNNIAIYVNKEVKKINIYNRDSLNEKYFGNIISNITPEDYGLNTIEDQYITLALIIYLPLENSHYYFRVLQENSNNDYIIYPLDTNKANTCKTCKIKGIYSCFFLLDNIYKDLSNDLILYAYGTQNIKKIELFVENNEDYYSIDLESINYHTLSNTNNTFFVFDKKDYKNTKFILINISSSNQENLTILTNFYINKYNFPPIQIYSSQLIYLNEDKSFNINIDNNYIRKYRIRINNTFGDAEINFDTNSSSLNKYNSLISGNRILSFVITNEMKNISICNKNYIKAPLVFNIKALYELNNPILEELYFNDELNRITKKTPIKYFLKEIEYKGAYINFLVRNNFNLEKDDLIIRGYILKYDVMKLINEKTFKPLNLGEEIKGKFDSRTNYGLITFDIGKNLNQYDYYYLVEIESNNRKLSEIELDIYASSKDSSQYSIPIKKYISGSFDLDLTKDGIQKQKYYIYDAQNRSSTNYIIEFSSNYKNIDIIFNKNISVNKSETITIGGIKKYFVNIDEDNKENNFFEVIINRTISNVENNYCKSANYIIRYYQSNVKVINYTVCLHGEIININNSQKLIIKNDNYQKMVGNYNITCIFNIFEKKRILLDESINTIALIDSENTYLKTEYYNQPFNETSCFLTNKINAEEYTGTVFIILKNNIDEGEISFYIYEFNITDVDKEREEKEKQKKEKREKDKDKRKHKLVGILISVLLVIIIIGLIIGFIIYRKMRDKNKDLEQKVNEISFSAEDTKDSDEDSEITFV